MSSMSRFLSCFVLLPCNLRLVIPKQFCISAIYLIHVSMSYVYMITLYLKKKEKKKKEKKEKRNMAEPGIEPGTLCV